MKKLLEILTAARANPANIKFSDWCLICEHFFGGPRQKGSSHCVYKTPWAGDPRVNIQRQGNMAKPYQVRQVLKAIDKLEHEHGK